MINIGDTVKVDFNGAQTTLCFEAIVRHVPMGSGDSWHFETDDEVFCVSEGCTVTKKKVNQ